MLRILVSVLVAFVAAEHLGFLVLEMFLWTKPVGMGVFGLTPEFAAQSASLAANQGLYNGFLSAGLIWSLVSSKDAYGKKVFFLTCVIVAGLYGAATASPSILFIQAMPAAIALAFAWQLNRRTRDLEASA